jgi:hypothetical protein
MIRLPVSVFGKTLFFSLDSGFTLSAIDQKYEVMLGDPLKSYASSSPLGTAKRLTAFPCPGMSVAGKELGLDQILCLDFSMATRISGQPCDGTLGMDFFKTQVISLCFDENRFQLSPSLPERDKSGFVAIPVRQTANYFTLEVLVNDTQQLTLMVDTGDNSSISLNASDWQLVFGNDPTQVTTVTVADAEEQVAQSKVGVINHMAVSSLNYTNLHATFIRNPSNPSHLGLGFFKRHNAIFDFPNQMLYLQPGARYAMPDQEDMSGLHLVREGERTVVYAIDEKSPAREQGLGAGDIIEAVNGQPTGVLSLRTIRQILRSRDGAPVALQIQHAGQELSVQFNLKQPI